ncbi:hypothetical protein BDQ12DRAFT_326889 [Crucibulum laeve]|uniref:Uncharacterized protein n=1 Tax=Crucibulum laeve TaxID=68775 RepID=A0A5C3LQM9_9AGAR|nr:hypothetical protein BDQ12DRAFT_326889 [Crucibulum laeve]
MAWGCGRGIYIYGISYSFALKRKYQMYIVRTRWAVALFLIVVVHASSPSDSSEDVNRNSIIGTSTSKNCNAVGSCRSLAGILWNCLATIFLCTWVAIHPNIPDPTDSWWSITKTRIKVMIYAVIVPECVLLWALRQWFGARYIARKYKKYGWTRTHGFFLQMGGFILYDAGTPYQVLSAEDFDRLIDAGEIDVPKITRKEIRDKSKSDGLSKALVILQTSWFIIQCVIRKIDNLSITHLEVATLAFTLLNGVMYVFWWHKPLNVQCSLAVARKCSPPVTVNLVLMAPASSRDFENSFRSTVTLVGTSNRWMRVYKSIKNNLGRSQLSNPSSMDLEISSSPILNPFHTKESQRGFWWNVGNMIIYRPLATMLRPVGEMCETSGPIDPGVLKLPSFHARQCSPKVQSRMLISISIIASLFGAVHCFPWASNFPTLQEKMIWRVGAILVTCAPVLFFFLGVGDEIPDGIFSRIPPIIFGIAMMLCIMSYIFARLALVVVSLTSLRSLPSEAYVVVQWMSFLPHLGLDYR